MSRLARYIRLGTRLCLGKFSSRPWPISVSFNVTRFCDLRCSHCYAMLNQLDQPDPSTEQLCSVIDQLADGGTLSIRMLGGEPLLRADLPVLIDKVLSRKMYCEIVTNGTQLRKRIAEWPALAQVDSFSVSLDGDKTTHDRIRGEGVFEKTVDGIEALREAGYPVRIHAAFAGESFEQDPMPHHFLAEFCKARSIPFNIATYCPNPGKDPANDEVNRNSFLNASKMYADLLDYKKRGYPVSTTSQVLALGVQWFDLTKKYILFGTPDVVPRGYSVCQAGYRNCFIDSDGGMYTCIPNWGKGQSVYEVGVAQAVSEMARTRQRIGCQICYNLAQWEYTQLFTFSNPALLLNIARQIGRLLMQRKKGGRS